MEIEITYYYYALKSCAISLRYIYAWPLLDCEGVKENVRSTNGGCGSFLKFERLLQIPITPVAKNYNLGKLLAMGLKKEYNSYSPKALGYSSKCPCTPHRRV